MDFLILVGQRKERYEGEYLPEALQVIDANGNDENPDFLIDRMAEAETFDRLSGWNRTWRLTWARWQILNATTVMGARARVEYTKNSTRCQR